MAGPVEATAVVEAIAVVQAPEDLRQPTPTTMVPPRLREASEFQKAFTAAKRATIAIIVSQLIALAFLGFYFDYSQLPLTILTLVMGCTVLCRMFSECVFKTAIVVYSFFAVASIMRVLDLYLVLNFIDVDSTDSEDSVDVPVGVLVLAAWPNVLGAILFVVGAVYAYRAVKKWGQIGSTPPV